MVTLKDAYGLPSAVKELEMLQPSVAAGIRYPDYVYVMTGFLIENESRWLEVGKPSIFV